MKHPFLSIAAVALWVAASPSAQGRDAASATWPARVLITNDDGIEDEDRLLALARAFRSQGAEVVVSVPAENRSGTSHRMKLASGERTLAARRLLRNERAAGGPAEAFYAVDGYPADSVVLALAGVMREAPPDLVVSGINGGANLAEAWLGSGTIGAARIAAYLGIPAIAVSGIDEEDPEAAGFVAAWVVELARSDAVRTMPKGAYYTVGLPEGPPNQIRGVRIAQRNGLSRIPILSRTESAESEPGAETWQVTGAVEGEIAPGSDLALHSQGYIVVTPMRADEHHWELLARLGRGTLELPAFKAPGGGLPAKIDSP